MWRESAECVHEDPELFFPEGSGPEAERQVVAAKAVCGRCRVLERCRRWALDAGLQYGVCGGTTPEERRAMRDSPQPQASRR